MPTPKKISKSEIIGSAPSMQIVFRSIGKLANTNATVLIQGESGTGKELVSKSLHKNSPRFDMPFIALNMADIPKELIESELFGHEKGAFTGAVEQRIGRFEQANGGTLFLDEIGDMPLETQTRLLRVLSNKEFFRVGGDKPIKVDVRILAATHQSLESLVAAGTFREDLYYRLNVIRVEVPPLRERKEDIKDLTSAFLKSHADSLMETPRSLSQEALMALTQYDWPGNVRQLENTCYWIALMAPTDNVKLEDLPKEILEDKLSSQNGYSNWETGFSQWLGDIYQSSPENMLGLIEPTLDKLMIDFALEKTNGKKQDAAKVLGLGRNTLTKKIQSQKD
jgi:two-component system nitrogen regulation response regulator GlnG